MSTRLTKKQNEIRLRGLRILARMIVRAHMASLREADAGRNGSGVGPAAADAPGTDSAPGAARALPPKEDEHVG